MKRENGPKVESIVAAMFVFAAFLATCFWPDTARAEIGGASLTSENSPGVRFFSSGYRTDLPAWLVPDGRSLNARRPASPPSFGNMLFAAGSLQFDAATFPVSEGEFAVAIFVSRTFGTDGAVFVNYATSDGTAIAGKDYETRAGTLFWGDGDDAVRTFAIPITADGLAEGPETVTITLSNPTGGAVIGSPNPALVTITDGAMEVPVISINNVTQPEGNGPNQIVFTVTLSPASQQTVTGNYSTENGTASAPSDFAAAQSQPFTFNPGETQKPIAIDVIGDLAPEGDESFSVNLSGVTNATIADGQGTGVLTNDDVAAADSVQLSSLTYAVNEDAGTATVTVLRSAANPGAVSVNYATSNGTATAGQDYSATSGTLNWAGGDGSAKTFTIPITNDTAQEANETVNITLSTPTGGATIGSPGSAVLTIVDNDTQPTISINHVSQPEGNAPNQMNFNVTLSGTFGQPVSVNYATANGTATAGSDYTAIVSTTLVFQPGETSKPVTVNILGDFVIEPNETVLVNLTDAVNATIFDSQGSGTLVNDDAAGVIQFDSASYSVTEGTPSVAITVTRTGGLASGVTVQFFSNDGTAVSGQDYSRVVGVLTFAPDQASITVNIPIIDDQIFEGPETVSLALDQPTGGATFGSPINAFLTIHDNDPQPTLSINDVSNSEGDFGFTQYVFTVTLTGQSAVPVSASYSTADATAVAPTDYTPILGGELTFDPGETSKQFQVAVRGDYTREQTETFLVNITGAPVSDGQGTGTIVNDDNGGAIRFNSAEYTAGEPGGPFTVTVQRTGGLADNVTVNYATSNGTAIAGQDYGAVSGTLTFVGGQTSRTFSIPITNDGVSEPNETLTLILSDPTGGGTLGSPNTATVTITDLFQPVSELTLFDYDADGRADLSVRRPLNNLWYVQRSAAGFSAMEWGISGDLAVPADYDGDARTDLAVFRPSTGQWFILNSANFAFQSFNWGVNGDMPAPADHDGDGKADLVLFRESNATWYRRFSDNSLSSTSFGIAGDKPVVGDFDGDGKGDIGVYRPSNNNWYIRKTTAGFFVQTWGIAGDIPVPADYDGDGRTDLAIWRPSTGQWYRAQSTLGFSTVVWGVSGDRPVPADYDGDGQADVAIWRPSNGTWYIVGSSAGISQRQFGQDGDLPTPAAFIY